MKVLSSKFVMLIIASIFLVAVGSTVSVVNADDICTGTGDCNITGEYQINSQAVVKVNTDKNTFIGHYAGDEHSSDTGNTFIGYEAGLGCDPDMGTPENPDGCGSTVRNNTAVGYMAGKTITLSTGNTSIGAFANRKGNTFGYNTSVGFIAGEENEGYGNTFIGAESGRYMKGTMIGAEEGLQNIALGLNALGSNVDKNITGNFNIHIGTYTGTESTDATATIALGHDTVVTDDNQMVVGSNSFRRCYDKNSNGEFDGDVDCETYSYDACETGDYNCYSVAVKDSYWGSGVTAQSPQDFSFNVTGGEGTNVAGANLTISGGQSTGNADGGSIIFKTSPAGSSGSSQNELVERMVIDADGFALRSSSGNDVLNILSGSNDLIMSIVAGSKFGVGTFSGPSAKFHLLNYSDSFDTVLIQDENNDTTPFLIDNAGNVGIGTTSPRSSLDVNGYVQLDLTSGIPPSADCDSASERGRMKVDNAASSLYICVDSGWVAK